MTPVGGGTFEVTGNYAYTALGIYPVSVTITEAGGKPLTVTDATVTVVNWP